MIDKTKGAAQSERDTFIQSIQIKDTYFQLNF